MTRPAIFRDLDLEAALETAKREGKLLLVDATASWCGPCKHMDRTTWVDVKVVQELAALAVAIQVDVDDAKDVAERLRILSMPTVVAFRDGAEIDRVVGLQGRDALLSWVEGLGRGETTLRRKRTEAAANPGDMGVRMGLAKALVDANELAEATAEYAWLWQNMAVNNPALGGVRQSFFLAELETLIERYPQARQSIDPLREAVAPGEGAQPELEALSDWLSLNHACKEDRRSLEWFLSARALIVSNDRLESLLEQRIVPLLVADGLWADIGALYKNPLAALTRAKAFRDHVESKLPPDAPPEMADSIRKYAQKQLRETAHRLVRALLAAKKNEEALALCDEAQRADPSPEMMEAISHARVTTT